MILSEVGIQTHSHANFTLYGMRPKNVTELCQCALCLTKFARFLSWQPAPEPAKFIKGLQLGAFCP